MFKKIAVYISAHVAQLVGAIASVALVVVVGYAAFSGAWDTDFLDGMAWQKNVYENNQTYGSTSYEVDEIEESDNRLHEDEGHDEGLNNDTAQTPDSDANQDQNALLAGNTTKSDNSSVVTNDTKVVNDPNRAQGSVVAPGEGGGGEGEAPGGSGSGGTNPGGSGDEPSGPGTTPGGDEGDEPSGPSAPAITDEQKEQLSARDDYVDESGNRLVALEVKVPAYWSFARGDDYRPDGVTVTATFKTPDGSQIKSVIPYGGKDGYSAYLSKAWTSGTHNATFTYGGLSTHAAYTVLNKRYEVAYGSYTNKWYPVKFPDSDPDSASVNYLGDRAMKNVGKKIQEEAIPQSAVGGFFTDLTDAHRFMITALGQKSVYDSFQKSGDNSYRTVQFLAPLDAGTGTNLEKMALGFITASQSEDEACVYMPSEEDGVTASVSAWLLVGDVPQGFQVQRVAGTKDNDFLGDQVMVGYSGDKASIEVPMGVTKVALTERNDKVTSLYISESVLDIDFGSITTCFPNLKHIQVGENNSQSFSSYKGVLYSANGLHVVYVPPKHESMSGDAKSWSPYAETIAEGAFAHCAIKSVVVPDHITSLQKNCFAGSTIDTLSFQGETPVKGMKSSGYQGSFYVPDSAYDTVCKQWVAALGETTVMRVGTKGSSGSGAGSGSGSGDSPGAGSGSGSGDGAGSGAGAGVAPGTYVYSKCFDAVVLSAEPSVLVGVKADVSKAYTIPDGVDAVGAGAFAASTQVRDVVVPTSVKQFRENSLVGLSDGAQMTLLGASGDGAGGGSGSGGTSDGSGSGTGGSASDSARVVSIDTHAFGDGTVPDITVYVPSALYSDYLKTWGAALGEDVAQRILKTSDQTYRYLNNAKYEVLGAGSGTSTPRLRLIEVYNEGQTFFEPEPGTVEIADEAFAGCTSLEIVHLPAGVKTLGANLFDGCTNLESVLVSNAKVASPSVGGATLYRPNANVQYDYDAATGVLYRKDAQGALTLLNVPTDTATVAIKANTVCLGDAAFKGCASLADTQESVTFTTPETLVSIGAQCFEGCASVQSVDLSACTALQTVGDSAFADCTSLRVAVLSDSVTSVGKGAFAGCSALTHCIAKGITQLNAKTFTDCTSLQLVQAPRVTVIGDECFYGCERLELIEDCIEGSGAEKNALDVANMTWIGDRAFAYCVSFGQNQSTTLNMKSLQHIGAQAFIGCHSLRTVVLSPALTDMGEEAFRDCTALSTLELNSSLATIGRYTFYGCVNMNTINISEHQQNTLEVVGACAFANCDALERLDLSACSKLAYVGDRTFEGCDELLRITLPAALTKVSDRCFDQCPNLSIVELSSATPTALGELVFGDQALEYLRIWVRDQQAYDKYLQAYEPVIDSEYGEGYTQFVLELRSDTSETLRGITYTAADDGFWVITDALENLSGNVMLSHDVSAIAPEAFKGCTKLTGIEYEYGASISLGDRAFEGCENLETVLLYGSIPAWGESVFAGCTKLTTLDIGGSSVNDSVACVGPRAFAGCSSLPMVTFRTSVGSIAEEAFADCTSLTAIASVANFRSDLKAYGDRAFMNCTSLKTAPLSSTYKALKTIGEQAFYNCDTLNGVSIPANVTSLGKACFAECDNLKTASFYGALEEVPDECFKNCPKLLKTGGTAAAFAGLKAIGNSAFEGCVSLEITGTDAAHTSGAWSLDKYTHLTTIGDKAFSGAFTHEQPGYGNPRLDTFTLAATLEHIGTGAFDGGVGLTRITLQSTPTLGKNAFAHMADGFTLEVPEGTYDTYLPILAASVGEDAAARMLYDASRAAATAAEASDSGVDDTATDEAAADDDAADGASAEARSSSKSDDVAAAEASHDGSAAGASVETHNSSKADGTSAAEASHNEAGAGTATDGVAADGDKAAHDKADDNSAINDGADNKQLTTTRGETL